MLSPDLAEEGDAGDVAHDVDDADEDPNEDDDEEESRQGGLLSGFCCGR